MTAKEIEDNIIKKVAESLSDAAYEISFDIESAYESAIDAFYASYTPRVYNRSYSTYEGSDSHSNYKKHIEPKRVGNVIETEAGIKVSSEFINAPYKDPVGYVFERTYFSGIHGTTGTGGIMSVSPERIMALSFDEIKNKLGTYVKKHVRY